MCSRPRPASRYPPGARRRAPCRRFRSLPAMTRRSAPWRCRLARCAATTSRLSLSSSTTSTEIPSKDRTVPMVRRRRHPRALVAMQPRARQPHGEGRRRVLRLRSAVTVPPCASTRCFTIDSPRPRPPWRRVRGRVRLAEWLEHVRQELRRNPSPLSVTTISAVPPSRCSCTRPDRPLRRELDRVRQQIPDDLLQPRAVAEHGSIAAIAIDDDLDALGVDRRLHDCDVPLARSAADRPSVRSSRSLPDMMRATSSSSSISCACRFALSRIAARRAVALRFVELAALQHVRPAEDRVQRRAQLVRDGREELILQPVRLFGAAARRVLALEQLSAHAPRAASCRPAWRPAVLFLRQRLFGLRACAARRASPACSAPRFLERAA